MGRSSPDLVSNPLELIRSYAHHYTHGSEKQYSSIFFFSKYRQECDSLLVFGGTIYRQRGGWAWVCGNKKTLLALCKLLEPYELRQELKELVDKMSREV